MHLDPTDSDNTTFYWIIGSTIIAAGLLLPIFIVISYVHIRRKNEKPPETDDDVELTTTQL